MLFEVLYVKHGFFAAYRQTFLVAACWRSPRRDFWRFHRVNRTARRMRPAGPRL